MKSRKIAALAASLIALVAFTIGVNTPANAQGFSHGGRPAFTHPYGHGGFAHPYYGGHGYYQAHYAHPYYGRAYYGHPYYGHPFYYGPGYVRHTWAWYQGRPAYWRAAHPYHGSPTLGVWIHI